MSDELLEAVREDSSLSPAEKETTIRLAKRDAYATLYTAEAGLARRLLAHTHVTIEGLTVPDGDARRDVPPDEYDGGEIVGVRARLPVGALQVKLRPRKTESHAEIVTDRVLATSAADDGEADGEEEVRADGGRRFPSTQEVADEIGASPDQLRSFLKTHPHASAGYVLSSFGADRQHRELVEEWIEGVRREQLRRTRGERR